MVRIRTNAGCSAFKTELCAHAPIRGEVLCDLPLDRADGLLDFGVGMLAVSVIDDRDDHEQAPRNSRTVVFAGVKVTPRSGRCTPPPVPRLLLPSSSCW